jgi:N-acetylglucosamine-6-sulfatase
MHFHGIWDLDELYDLADDPLENNNLLAKPGHEGLAEKMSAKLFAMLEQSGGMSVPISADSGLRRDSRDPRGPKAAEFPDSFLRAPKKKQSRD